MGLLHICLYISYFHKRVRCDWAFHWGTWKNMKRCTPFPNLSLPNSNLEISFHLTVLKGDWAVMVVFEYSPFCLSGTPSATIWHLPSALAIAAFSEGKTTPSESYCYPHSIVHTSTSQRQRHTLVHLHTQIQHFEPDRCIIIAFLPVKLACLKKKILIHLSLIPSSIHLSLILIAVGLAVVFVSVKRGIY